MKKSVEKSANAREWHEIARREAVDYLFSVLDSVIDPDGFDPATQYVWTISPLDQVKELVKLANLGKEEPRWLDRIKKLEGRLEKIRKTTVE